MFKPKYLKQAKLLKKGVRKFLRYKEDIIDAETMEGIRGKLADFEQAVSSKEKESIKVGAKSLTKACEKAVPPSGSPGLRENLEVIFVAVIIAVGIRAYFLQPFRIPTGSMQPTLNGIIARPHDPADGEFDAPGLIGKAFEKVAQGRTYVDFTIPAGSRIESIREKTSFKFFTSTIIELSDLSAEPIKVRVSRKALLGDHTGSDFGLAAELGIKFAPGAEGKVGGRVAYHRDIDQDLHVRGYVDTGDQVLVDKLSYHFRKPRRGEVFVFNTKHIDGINLENPDHGSQHYIKRLAGLPGDELSIRSGDRKLYVGGQPASERYLQRVWEGTGEGYRGYGFVNPDKTGEWDEGVRDGERVYALGDGRYMALGDNSYNSSDSRMWGSVPEPNVVGPALMVYWPFEHWGKIR